MWGRLFPEIRTLFLNCVAKDKRLAFHYYQKSAAQGNVNGKFFLGECYTHGVGTEIDDEKSWSLIYEAATEVIVVVVK
jgi:TPR repeat protein